MKKTKYWECVCGKRWKSWKLTDEARCKCDIYEMAWYLMPAEREALKADRRVHGEHGWVQKHWTKPAKRDAAMKAERKAARRKG